MSKLKLYLLGEEEKKVNIEDETFSDVIESSNTTELNESTYFSCLKILSESLGKLPLKMYQNTDRGIIKSDKQEMYSILRMRPNQYMTSTIFWSTVEMNRNHHGNAYVWLRYEGIKLVDMWIMPTQNVTVIIDNKGIFGEENTLWYMYIDRYTTKRYIFSSDEVMHFKTSMTFDGITGIPVREILKTSVEGASESQTYMNKLYKQGMTGKAVLEYTGELDKKAREKIRQGFEDFANGSKNTGKIIPVPLGMKVIPLDIKLTDAQFFDLKKYSALQIASAFGIKPNQINDYDKSSYASAEAQNLAFYVETLIYILKQYEEEITYKVLSNNLINQGYYFKFNVNVILRADSQTQMSVLTSAVNNGIYTVDEAREHLDLPSVEGGTQNIVNGNYIPLTKVGSQYEKGGEQNG